MIPSVAARKKSQHCFSAVYQDECAFQNVCPMWPVQVHLPKGILDFKADRLRPVDWGPVLKALAVDKSLKFIAIRSTSPLDEGAVMKGRRKSSWNSRMDTNDIQRAVDARNGRTSHNGKVPPNNHQEVLQSLSVALQSCLKITPVLVCLELQGLAFKKRELENLVEGIQKNHTLEHLSLERSPIGDEGCEVLCHAIKNCPHITSVNFSCCGLTSKGAEVVTGMIKHQMFNRHSEAWKDTLRYQHPNMDAMGGLRRITLNGNPLINDEGVTYIAEALREDLWLKAIDLQHCGMSNCGARELLEALKHNTCLVILDLHSNPLVCSDLLERVMTQLIINSDGKDTEYHWISEQHIASENTTRKSPTGSLPLSASRKKLLAKANQTTFHTRSKTFTASSLKRRNASSNSSSRKFGIPWRIAARLQERRDYPYDVTAGLPNVQRFSELNLAVSSDGCSISGGETEDSDYVCELREELQQLHQELDDEKRLKQELEQRVLSLAEENEKLHNELEYGRPGFVVVKESDLVEVEVAFQKFYSFLELLKKAGLHHLTDVAGLNNFHPSEQNLSYKKDKQLQNHPVKVSPETRSQENKTNEYKYFPNINLDTYAVNNSTGGMKTGDRRNGSGSQQIPPWVRVEDNISLSYGPLDTADKIQQKSDVIYGGYNEVGSDGNSNKFSPLSGLNKHDSSDCQNTLKEGKGQVLKGNAASGSVNSCNTSLREERDEQQILVHSQLEGVDMLSDPVRQVIYNPYDASISTETNIENLKQKFASVSVLPTENHANSVLSHQNKEKNNREAGTLHLRGNVNLAEMNGLNNNVKNSLFIGQSSELFEKRGLDKTAEASDKSSASSHSSVQKIISKSSTSSINSKNIEVKKKKIKSNSEMVEGATDINKVKTGAVESGHRPPVKYYSTKILDRNECDSTENSSVGGEEPKHLFFSVCSESQSSLVSVGEHLSLSHSTWSRGSGDGKMKPVLQQNHKRTTAKQENKVQQYGGKTEVLFASNKEQVAARDIYFDSFEVSSDVSKGKQSRKTISSMSSSSSSIPEILSMEDENF